MTRLTRLTASVVAFSVLLLGSTTRAVTIDWVTVGNPGNASDQNYGDGTFGSVGYTYKISKTEVTNAQYVEFLNKVDAAGLNSLSLYNSGMTSDPVGGINYSVGAAAGSHYSSKTGQQNNPVLYVSFFDSMRFTNWLQNNQTSGGTESGVYTISDGLSETRASGVKYWLPSEDEWYKAAYYDPTKGGTGYWLYPMQTDSDPYSDNPSSLNTPDDSKAGNFAKYDGTANGYDDGYAVTGSNTFSSTQNYLTDVGAYTTATSYYGTFDQGGNVYEWNEAVLSGSFRGLRGGSWGDVTGTLAASFRGGLPSTSENDAIGFRIASPFFETATVPEPSTAALAGIGAMVLMVYCRRRSQKSADLQGRTLH